MKIEKYLICALVVTGCTIFATQLTDLEPNRMCKQEKIDPIPSGWPVLGRISSAYGMRRHPLWHRRLFHEGIDIKAPYASSVRATQSGKIEWAGYKGGYGRCVVIDHGFNWKTMYAHLKNTLVVRGSVVLKGQKIGLVGSSGHSTGPHLHYEVRYKNSVFNPKLFTSGFDQSAISQLGGSSQTELSRLR